MFSLLKKLFASKVPAFQEKVWTSKPYKFQGLYEDLSEAIQKGDKVFVFTHFEKTYQELCYVLEQKEVNFYSFAVGDNAAILSFHQVAIFQANALDNRLIQQLQDQQIPAQCFILEHYPIRKQDDDLLEKLKVAFPRTKATFYVSLDDALLQRFVTDNFKQILTKLGMKPEESISHPLISKSITRTQERISQEAKNNKHTYSPEEWMKVNL